MQKFFGHLVTQFREFFKTLTPVKRMSVMASGVVIVVAMAILSGVLMGTDHAPLFKDIPPDQLPLIVDQLQKRGINFKISEDSKTILIPAELIPSTQMALMTEIGGAKVGQVGLEIFDKQDFGTTSYAQKINYQRALQGELVRSINTLDAVKQSKVILALPPKKTFLEESGQPSASVVVEMHPGKNLTSEQVRGITFLVSSAVENMDADRVTVVDSRGKMLSSKYSADSAITGELLDLKRKVELNLSDRIEGILSKVVGAGKVIAKVDASLNAKSVVMTEEEVDPEATALRSSQTEEEVLDGARTNPTGVPGARANLPGADQNGQVGFSQNVRKELKTSNFEVPKTVRNVKEAAGGVERLSVAVLVDGNMTSKKNDDGTSEDVWQPRSPEEMKKLEQIVKNAIGFNAARGDSVTIENIAFQSEDFTEAQKILTTLERKKLLHALMKWVLIGVSLVLFFFMVVRPFVRWITDSFQDTVEDMLPKTIEELEELQSVDNSLPGMSGALPVLEESIDPDKAESELLRERIVSIMEQDEEKAAGAFSLWLSRKDM
ncbi:MAG TPA: flagellar M-ring protein FliF [Bdellovibrionales bacterium]|nr:flagellar M-ring protein FliF [Pseudobdellovibrionaceae bacterium]HAG90804.1 flagellar M-ring protein FliF [Bdellovibrionales bacterium]|tara:strand:+ start:4849 stop:6498 length:1650 start_codon:yes stop_codon:yes gene_type:complete